VARPWRAELVELPPAGGTVAGAVAGGDGFPAVPDVEFPQFRAAARRLLAAPAFVRVDSVYHDTFGLARAQADDLRLSLLGQTSRAELTDAVLQQQPRLGPPTVTRLRGLCDPSAAAAVVLARTTGLPPAQLCRLRRSNLTDCHCALHVRHGVLNYRVPARAAGLVRAVLRHHQRTRTGDATSMNDITAENEPGWLFTKPDGAPLDERALQQLRDQAAAGTGIHLTHDGRSVQGSH
jgi:integrase